LTATPVTCSLPDRVPAGSFRERVMATRTETPSIEQLFEPRSRIGRELNIGIYADGANIPELVAACREGLADGFTTNPTLMARAGVANYRAFAREVLSQVVDLPISFEVFADDLDGMGAQAREIASWGSNVFVKVPAMTTRAESTVPLIRTLAADGLRLNVTAVLALEQVEEVLAVLPPAEPAIVSVFAGRVADTGRDPVAHMTRVVAMAAGHPGVRVLWASPREVLNLYQARDCGCDLIAITPDLLAKIGLRGKDLLEFSRETVQMFYDDAVRAGYRL
jgi:transaldolase